MSDSRTFVLIGNFTDNITPSLQKINDGFVKLRASAKKNNASLKGLSVSFKKLGGSAKAANNEIRQSTTAIQKNLKSLNAAAKEAQGSFNKIGAPRRFGKGLVLSTQNLTREFGLLNRQINTTLSLIDRLNRKRVKGLRQSGDTPGRPSRRGGRDITSGDIPRRSQRVRPAFTGSQAGAVFRGSLAANAVGYAGRMLVDSVFAGVRKIGDYFNYAIQDELSDLAQAGAIFSFGKSKKVAWADSIEEAIQVQRNLEREVVKISATLPGPTDQYVRNAKLLSDTTFRIFSKNADAYVAAMTKYATQAGDYDAYFKNAKGGALSPQKMQQQAFVYGTKELAKFATMTDMTQPAGSGAVDFNILFEQMLNTPQVSLMELRRRYNAIKRNPLLSAALEENIDAINATQAGSIERTMVFLKMFRGMFPPEVQEKFQRSVMGVTGALQTWVGSLEAGLFGLKRTINVTDEFGVVGQNLYSIFRDIYNGLGAIAAPILQYLPNIWDPMKIIGDALASVARVLQTSVDVFGKAQAEFRGLGFGELEKNVRASIKAMLYIAGAAGGDASKIKEIESRLGNKDLDVGKAIIDSLGVLFTSTFMDDLGYALGKGIGTVLSDIVTFFTGDLMGSGAKGLVGGFTRGFNEAGGLKALTQVVALLIKGAFELLVKGLPALFKQAPLETTVLVGMVTGIIPAVVGSLLSSLVTWTVGKIVAAISIKAIGTAVMTKLSGWLVGLTLKMASAMATMKLGTAALMAKLAPAVSGLMTGLALKFAVLFAKIQALFASLMNPYTLAIAVVVALGALVYVFRDQIKGAIENLEGFIASKVQGPLKDFLLGVTQVWKGVLGTFTGIVDWVGAFFSGDEKAMAKAGEQISKSLAMWWNGLKQVVKNLIDAAVQVQMWIGNWAWSKLQDGVKALWNSIISMLDLDDGVQRSFTDQLGQAVVRLAARIGSWLTGIELPGTGRAPDGGKKGYVPPSPYLLFSPLAAPKNIWDNRHLLQGAPNYNGKGKRMGLGSAIKTEMAHKPSGSHLVIANSSETVIPANKGYGGGMSGLLEMLGDGFRILEKQLESITKGLTLTVKGTQDGFKEAESANAARHRDTESKIANLAGTFRTLTTSMPMMGGGSGQVVAVGRMLQQMGLNVAEHPSFGDGRVGRHAPNSYHYSGRAIDVTGSPAKLDEAYSVLKAAGGYKELLWRTAGHWDHLHVAYANGLGNGVAFNSLRGAQSWERSMVPGSVKVASVTSNSSEGFGGGTINGGIHVSVQAGNVQDPEELASIVAMRIGEAVADARASSIFV